MSPEGRGPRRPPACVRDLRYSNPASSSPETVAVYRLITTSWSAGRVGYERGDEITQGRALTWVLESRR